jgi:hypothetical protein
MTLNAHRDPDDLPKPLFTALGLAFWVGPRIDILDGRSVPRRSYEQTQ